MNYIDGEKVPEDVQCAVDAVLTDDAIYGRADGGGDEICEGLVKIAIANAILAERRRCVAILRENHTVRCGEPAEPMLDELLHQMEAGQ